MRETPAFRRALIMVLGHCVVSHIDTGSVEEVEESCVDKGLDKRAAEWFFDCE